MGPLNFVCLGGLTNGHTDAVLLVMPPQLPQLMGINQGIGPSDDAPAAIALPATRGRQGERSTPGITHIVAVGLTRNRFRSAKRRVV